MVAGGPVFGTGPKEVQCVVHPAHIPFIIKTKTALTGRFRDPGIIGRIFGNEDAAGIPAFDPGIHSFHKVYGIAVDTTAFIALPVQDPADGIHAQTVEMVSLQPVVGAGLEKAADLSPGMHEIITAPLADTNIRVRIFKKGSAVVLHQCVVINGKMNGDKIQKNTNPCLVEKIHQEGVGVRAKGIMCVVPLTAASATRAMTAGRRPRSHPSGRAPEASHMASNHITAKAGTSRPATAATLPQRPPRR